MRLALSIAAGATAFALPWAVRIWKARRWGMPVEISVDPREPSAEALAGYFAEVARRLDERPERMKVAIDGRTDGKCGISLDFLPDGNMCATVEGAPPKRFGLRRRWIPDHPVPLDLRSCRLWIDPVDANRFRVMDRMPFRAPSGIYMLCTLIATFGLAYAQPECLAFATGLASGCLAAQTLHAKGMIDKLRQTCIMGNPFHEKGMRQ